MNKKMYPEPGRLFYRSVQIPDTGFGNAFGYGKAGGRLCCRFDRMYVQSADACSRFRAVAVFIGGL